ncbi:Uncharacterized protein APZ42_004384 [Daphnia magna]|uniref:Uncharacterized protein n=1 Tax=Daphnia magna TaxID=35525 RepID=A0A164H3G1_9CRUS|nr:Uncharacterized protein APZ42_004384 [Daphnia magna]
MGERHVSNEQDTRPSSTALLKGFYECILDGQLVCQCQSNHPKSQLESCENATLRHAETIEFLLLRIFNGGSSFFFSYLFRVFFFSE